MDWSRETDRSRSAESEVSVEYGDSERSTPTSRTRVRERVGRLFSPRFFLVSLGAIAAGLIVGRTFVPLFSGLGGLLGVFAAGFLLGLRGGRRRYVATATAGAGVAGIASFVDYFVLSLVGGIGLPLVALGAAGGAIAAVVGRYFGRDLRTGITREL